MGVVLDEAEAAGGFLEAVEAHDEALYLAAFAEELMDLLLGGVEGEVADVERGCVAQFVFGRGRAAPVVIAVAVVLALLGWVSICIGSDYVCIHTFAVAYELGLSRRSMVLRRAGMADVELRFPGRCDGLCKATAAFPWLKRNKCGWRVVDVSERDSRFPS
jgi:hypothetical protein